MSLSKTVYPQLSTGSIHEDRKMSCMTPLLAYSQASLFSARLSFFLSYSLQEVFHAYLNKFENVVTHLFLVILSNN